MDYTKLLVISGSDISRRLLTSISITGLCLSAQSAVWYHCVHHAEKRKKRAF